jgi:arabinofuranan 3-O-arabinosyltransferase
VPVSRRSLTVAIWTLGILNFGTNLMAVVHDEGYDTIPVWRSLHAVLTHGPIYTHHGAGDFLYPPSALLLLLPLGALDVHAAKGLLFVANIAAILLATGLLLRLFRLRWAGLAGAVALFGLSLAYPVFFALGAGNVDPLVLLGFVGFLIAANRGRWMIGAALLGLTLALKPVLAPVVLILLLYRRWAAAFVAVLVPSVLSGIVLIAVPGSRAYFSNALPLLLHGQNSRIQEVSYSLVSVGRRLDVPVHVTDTIRVALLAATALLLWKRLKGSAAEPRRLIELSTIALASAFLLASFAFPPYGVFLLPFAVAVAAETSAAQHWLTWSALFCIGATQSWYLDRLPRRLNQLLGARFTFGLLLVLVASYTTMRREREEEAAKVAHLHVLATGGDR